MDESPNPNNVPNMLAHEQAETVLILIDVINDLEFEGGEQLLPHALPMAECIAKLKERTEAANIPSIYVNDNFGQWRSDFSHLIDHCLEDKVRGEPIARRLKPSKKDYFVLKPKHSGFYLTTLELLLEYLGAKTLILTGVAGDICVLFTANDAYMHDYKLHIPADCIASNTVEFNQRALQIMKRAQGRYNTVNRIRFESSLKRPHPRPPLQGGSRWSGRTSHFVYPPISSLPAGEG